MATTVGRAAMAAATGNPPDFFVRPGRDAITFREVPYYFLLDRRNIGVDFVPYPITLSNDETYQAEFIRVIMEPDPFVMAAIRGSDKIFSRPLYATARFSYDPRPHYNEQDMFLLGPARVKSTDAALELVKDVTLTAEVFRYRTLCHEVERVETRLKEMEDTLGRIVALKYACTRRLEMADAVARIQEEKEAQIRLGSPWLRPSWQMRRGRRS